MGGKTMYVKLNIMILFEKIFRKSVSESNSTYSKLSNNLL